MSNWRKILCPFHTESDPSACVTSDGGFICFACGVKGNLYHCLKEVRLLDDAGALREYQRITGEDYDPLSATTFGDARGFGLPESKRYNTVGHSLFPAWFREGPTTD